MSLSANATVKHPFDHCRNELEEFISRTQRRLDLLSLELSQAAPCEPEAPATEPHEQPTPLQAYDAQTTDPLECLNAIKRRLSERIHNA